MKKIVITILMVLFTHPVYPGVDQWSTYTAGDGLPVEYVHTVAADRWGNAWFGFGEHWNGIAKFSRPARTVITVPCPLEGCRVRDIAVDTAGTVWCLTDQGRLLSYREPDWSELALDESFQDIQVRQLLTDRSGSLWLATDSGVLHYDSTGWRNYTGGDGLLSSNVNALALDPNGLVWCATDSSIAVFTGSDWLAFTTLDGLPEGGYGVIAAGPDGSIWANTEDEKILRIAPEQVITYDIEQWGRGVPKGKSICMAVDRHGHLWVCGSYRYGEDGKGYTTFDGKNWQKYVYPDQDTHSTVLDLALDSVGNLWFATLGSGVRKLGELDGWRSYTAEDGLAEDSFDHIAADSRGNVWFGSYHGEAILMFDGVGWEAFTKSGSSGLESTEVYALAADSAGQLWCGTIKGLYKYDGSTWETVFTRESNDPSTFIYDLFVDSKDNLWVGTEGGAREWDGERWTLYTVEDGLANNTVCSIAEDSLGHMWFGSSLGHFSRFDGKEWASWIFVDSLSFHGMECVVADNRGNVYFAILSAGIKKYDGSEWTTLNGLPSTWSIDMAVDSLGHLWAATNQGLHMWDGGKWITYGEEAGLPTLEIQAIETDAWGNLWMAGRAGVSSFNPALEIKPVDYPVANENEEISSNAPGKASLPRAFSLARNFPNPFNPSTTISYTIPERSPVRVTLNVFSIRGSLVRRLIDKLSAPGTYTVAWDGTDSSGNRVASGVYFYHMHAGEFVQTRKMVLVK
ncbi:MAG TPA: two-component regulator propeller domain-containing protein [archaeon]|nr:two-component regulator propeller domain-containing protein [archaeon]